MATDGQKRSDPKRLLAWGLVLVLAVVTAWQAGLFNRTPHIALVTAGGDPFWEITISGAQAAAKKYDIRLSVYKPTTADEQTSVMRDLLAGGVDGIAVSPLNVKMQSNDFQRAAAATSLLTLDSDIPVAGRLCFVGTDNYAAGRRCGEMVRRAIPDGGRVLVSIGSIDKANGRQRRQGLIDELLDRTYEPDRVADPVGAPLSGDRFEIVTTLLDANDEQRAQEMVGAALTDAAPVDCVVGMFGYSTPAILRALGDAGMLGQVVVVGFDYAEETLAGIESGHVFGTMAQDPYSYGYHAVRILAEVANGRQEIGLPLFDQHSFPCYPVDAENVAIFRESMIH